MSTWLNTQKKSLLLKNKKTNKVQRRNRLHRRLLLKNQSAKKPKPLKQTSKKDHYKKS